MKKQLINKIKKTLNGSIEEECQVVYLMVEIRKLLDRDNNSKYPLLRFYCNWVVHIDKDRITPEMKNIMEEIYQGIILKMKNPKTSMKTKVIDFLYMEDLKLDMKSFFREYELSIQLIIDKKQWLSFVILLTNILIDQPINYPLENISFFSFYPASDGCVRGEIRFKKEITINSKKYDKYTFGNVY